MRRQWLAELGGVELVSCSCLLFDNNEFSLFACSKNVLCGVLVEVNNPIYDVDMIHEYVNHCNHFEQFTKLLDF